MPWTLVEQLGRDGRLTTALLVQAAVHGRLALVEAACAHLTGTPLPRVTAAFGSRRRSALKALLLKGGIGAQLGELLATAHRRWSQARPYREADARTGNERVLRQVVRELGALPGLDAQIECLLADLELGIERNAAHAHRDQVLLAA